MAFIDVVEMVSYANLNDLVVKVSKSILNI